MNLFKENFIVLDLENHFETRMLNIPLQWPEIQHLFLWHGSHKFTRKSRLRFWSKSLASQRSYKLCRNYMYCFQQMHRYGFRGRCTKFPNICDEITQVVSGNGYFQTERLG